MLRLWLLGLLELRLGLGLRFEWLWIGVNRNAGAEEDFEQKRSEVLFGADVASQVIVEVQFRDLVSFWEAQVGVADGADAEVQGFDSVEDVFRESGTGGGADHFGGGFAEDLDEVGAAMLAFDDMEFAEVEAEESEVEFTEGEAPAVILDV